MVGRFINIMHVALLAVVPLVASSGARAQSDPRGVIQARQATYKRIGAAMKVITDQLKAGEPSKAVIGPAVQVIAAGARSQFGRFPADSGQVAGVRTDALPAIWADRAKFDGLGRQFIAESAKLTAVVAGNDTAAMRAQVAAVGKVCASCHRAFRSDD